MYPVVGEVILLLESMAIPLSEAVELPEPSEMARSKEEARAFYDEVGWTKSQDGVYVDTQIFTDSGDENVGGEYASAVHRRVQRHIDASGTYLLDIASGPIPLPEYLGYSEGYDIRVCADISIRALREARARLGDRGVYVLCDITRIPIRDDSVDGFVSLHTIYHVEAGEQLTAFSELVRVLKPGRRGVRGLQLAISLSDDGAVSPDWGSQATRQVGSARETRTRGPASISREERRGWTLLSPVRLSLVSEEPAVII